tara:strand:+ start:464 stop:688 length:225 start_codon:yes stop_codon:yes gene_type:complete
MSKQQQQQHVLHDMISGEGVVVFTVQADGRVEVFEQCHPDLPGSSEVHTVERAREIYRAAKLAGCVNLDDEVAA